MTWRSVLAALLLLLPLQALAENKADAPDAKFATDNLREGRDFYSKVHFVAIASLAFGASGDVQFKYNRYPKGGPERIQAGDGEFARSFSHLVAVNVTMAEATSPSPSSSPVAEKSESAASLLDGKLKIDVPPDFVRGPNDPNEPKTLAKFTREDGAWGEVLRGTHGLTPDELEGYLKKRVAEYTKGFSWLPKGSHLQWLRKEIVLIDGRKWADWRYVPVKGKSDYRNNPVYTRFLTTSYKGQLLEITFTSNLNTDPRLKEEIDRIMHSIRLDD